MSNITVVFQNQPPIHIKLYNTTAATRWLELFVQHYQQKFPLFRDMQKYDWQYLEYLVDQANKTCGWNFTTKIQSILQKNNLKIKKEEDFIKCISTLNEN
jgi:hypothetical protein